MQQVDGSDLERLLALPDHNDVQFLGLFQENLQAACIEIKESRDQKAAHELVSIFLEAEQSYEQALDDHYVSFIKTLSEPTTKLVSSLMTKLSESDNLSHTSTDYVGLSQEFPDFMKTRIVGGCDRVLASSIAPQEQLLMDNHIHRENLTLGVK